MFPGRPVPCVASLQFQLDLLVIVPHSVKPHSTSVWDDLSFVLPMSSFKLMIDQHSSPFLGQPQRTSLWIAQGTSEASVQSRLNRSEMKLEFSITSREVHLYWHAQGTSAACGQSQYID